LFPAFFNKKHPPSHNHKLTKRKDAAAVLLTLFRYVSIIKNEKNQSEAVIVPQCLL
jgi:hypothetical protein